MKKANIITSLCLIGLAIFFLQKTQQVKEAAGATLGPRFFPYAVLWAIIALSSIIIFNTLRDKTSDDKKFIEVSNIIKVFITFIMFTVYSFTLDKVGFVVATALFLMALSTFFYGKLDKKLFAIGGFSLITPLLLFQIFNNFFKVLLP